jgi:hypothetical protein
VAAEEVVSESDLHEWWVAEHTLRISPKALMDSPHSTLKI